MTNELKIPAMMNDTGVAVYVLGKRDYATDNGTVSQCAIAPVGKYADAGFATGWVNESKLTFLS